VTIDTQEPLKPRSAHVDDAVQLAIAGRWEEAIELNRFLIENYDTDEATQNRLGKALSELGRYQEAKQAYDTSLALNPHNPVARKNVQKLEALMSNPDVLKGVASKVDLNLFVEEMGKTVTTALKAAAPDVCSKVAAGDVAELRIEGDGIAVDTTRGVRLGSLEAKLARRLFKFIQGGNRYQAGVMSCEGTSVRLIVREVYQDPKFAGKPSFPITRKREVEFRPYTREGLVSRDIEAFATDDDDDDAEVAVRPSAIDLDEEDGMHEVDELEEADDSADGLEEEFGESADDELEEDEE